TVSTDIDNVNCISAPNAGHSHNRNTITAAINRIVISFALREQGNHVGVDLSDQEGTETRPQEEATESSAGRCAAGVLHARGRRSAALTVRNGPAGKPRAEEQPTVRLQCSESAEAGNAQAEHDEQCGTEAARCYQPGGDERTGGSHGNPRPLGT